MKQGNTKAYMGNGILGAIRLSFSAQMLGYMEKLN